ncbi:hypothetical protein [Variovorax sp. E3]|uniref:hypothetical protein n=1 Tax=Variovorax sp. E3 TaxID=1914993 RepID=UPI0018DE8E25|nr:hypothetical protein [Variovorax sp. E3]
MQRPPARNSSIGLRALPVCALLACLGACEPAVLPASPTVAPAVKTSASSPPSASVRVDGSSLQSLLGVFGGQAAAPWSAFDSVPGVRWSDAKPLNNPDTVSPDAAHYRGGDMLLAGFGEVDVPDGKVGAQAGVRKDNEGHVGVVLHGNVSEVLSIALQKFYPSDDTQGILWRQLGNDAMVRPIAASCALDDGTSAPNTQKNVFYELGIPGIAMPVFAETYVDEDGGNQGPGVTNFVFYRSKPWQRIEGMQCKAS